MERPLELKINLLEHKPRVQVHIIWGLVFFLLAIMGSMSIYFYTAQDRELTEQVAENGILKEDIKSYEPEMLILKPIEEMETAISIKTNEEAALAAKKVSHVDIINEINKVIPPEVTMFCIDIKSTRVTMTGFSHSHKDVAKLLAGLTNKPQFTGITLLTSEIKADSNEVQFTFEMEWEADQK